MDKLERQEQIYKTAAKMFFMHGYHGTSIRMLAHEMGVDSALLYFYYKSKNDLLYKIILKGLEQQTEGFEAALKSADTPVEQMSAALATYMRYILRRKEEAALGSEIRHLEPKQRAKVSKISRDYTRNFSMILERGIKEGVFRPCNVTFTTVALLSNATPIAIWYRSDGSIKEDEIVTWYVTHGMHSLT